MKRLGSIRKDLTNLADEVENNLNKLVEGEKEEAAGSGAPDGPNNYQGARSPSMCNVFHYSSHMSYNKCYVYHVISSILN
jgi:hypothetical protein